MVKTARTVVVAMGLMAAGPAGGAPATLDTEHEPAMKILVMNHVGVPPRDVVIRAQAETARIYAAVGVRLDWIDPLPAFPRLTMKIISDSNLGGQKGAADALGAAPAADEGTGRVAYAFYARIEATAQRHGTDVAKVLGLVMAHELGHLLLARGAHSSTGIMSGRWGKFEMELLGAGLLSFTKEQAELIRTAVCRQADKIVSPRCAAAQRTETSHTR